MKKKLKKKRGNEEFSFEDQYRKCWAYIKSSKNFIYTIAIIFIISALVGFFVPVSESLSAEIIDYLRGILEETFGMSQFELVNYILVNNVQSSFIGLFFGFILGIFPFFATVFNGFLVGFVSALSVKVAGFGTLFSLLPHGIFELPAIFISLGLGLKFGTFAFRENRKKVFMNYLRESLRVFVFVIIPLLIIAAMIEGTLIYLF